MKTKTAASKAKPKKATKVKPANRPEKSEGRVDNGEKPQNQAAAPQQENEQGLKHYRNQGVVSSSGWYTRDSNYTTPADTSTLSVRRGRRGARGK